MPGQLQNRERKHQRLVVVTSAAGLSAACPCTLLSCAGGLQPRTVQVCVELHPDKHGRACAPSIESTAWPFADDNTFACHTVATSKTWEAGSSSELCVQMWMYVVSMSVSMSAVRGSRRRDGRTWLQRRCTASRWALGWADVSRQSPACERIPLGKQDLDPVLVGAGHRISTC